MKEQNRRLRVGTNHLTTYNFAYKTNINMTPFLLATIIAASIAILTVTYIVNKAANQNTVKSLRYE